MENVSTEVPVPQRAMTFGEKLVGITFNPSNDDKVGRAKKLFAAAADLLKEDFESRENSGLAATLYEHTLGEILNAQMNVVKVLTLKY
jgi:hypothetical protein